MASSRHDSERHPRPVLICHVCGDIARGMNFDVITCMSCKAFFRRNAFQRVKLSQCQFDSNCNIDIQTRSTCSSCRLKKCFTLGMNPDLIRSPYQSQSKRRAEKIRTQQANVTNLPRPQPIDLLNHDRSSLSSDDWNLLSNIIHAYDEQKLVIHTQHLLHKQASLPLKLRSKPTLTLELIGSFYSAVEPLVNRTDLFRQCPAGIRRVIIQNNTAGVGSFNATLAAIEANVYDSEAHIHVCNEIYGPEYVAESYRVMQRFDSNRTLVKMMVLVLAFGSNSSIVTFNCAPVNSSILHSIYLIRIQDLLVTVVWKYLVRQYGWSGAVKHFNILVKNFLDTLKRMEDNQSQVHWQMVDNIVDHMNDTLVWTQ